MSGQPFALPRPASNGNARVVVLPLRASISYEPRSLPTLALCKASMCIVSCKASLMVIDADLLQGLLDHRSRPSAIGEDGQGAGHEIDAPHRQLAETPKCVLA